MTISILSPLFITSIHTKIDELANRQLSAQFRLLPGSRRFIELVQADVDLLTIWNPGRSGPFESPRHLHAVYPVGGYDPQVCKEIAEKKISPKSYPDGDCQLNFRDLIDLGEQVAINYISDLIRKSRGNLSSQEVGSVLYIMGSFFHYHQDYSAHTKPTPIVWPHHIDKPGIHGRDRLKTDANPTEEMRSEAIRNTAKFYERFWKGIKEKVNHEESFARALAKIRDFEIEPGKKAVDYKPSNYSEIFPSYPGRLPSRWDSFLNAYSGIDFRSGNFQLGFSLGRFWPVFGKNRFQGWLGSSLTAFYESSNSLNFVGKGEFGLVPVTALFLTGGIYGKLSQSFLLDRTKTVMETGVVIGLESPALTALLCENQVSFGLEAQFPIWSSHGGFIPSVLGVARVALP